MMVQQAMLCGDEIQSAVVDLGTAFCRFGSAGQDLPRHVFRSEIGLLADEYNNIKRLYGDSGLRSVNKDIHIRKLSGSSPTTSDDVENTLIHGVEHCMRLDAKQTPIMLAYNTVTGAAADLTTFSSGSDTTSGNVDTTGSNTRSNKERIVESCFETVQVPGLYMASSAMLSSFSSGRVTSLVVDVGAAGTRISPLVDGYEMHKSVIYTSRGGSKVDQMILQELTQNQQKVVKPWYECSRTGSVSGIGASSNVHNASTSQSFRNMHVLDIMRDIQQWMCFVPHMPIQLSAHLRKPLQPHKNESSTTTTTTSDDGTRVSSSAAEAVDTAKAIDDPEASQRRNDIHKFREEELKRRSLQFPPPYELPDGTIISSGDALCTIPERVFFPIFSAVSEDLDPNMNTLVVSSSSKAAATGSGAASRVLVKQPQQQSPAGRKRARSLLEELGSSNNNNNNNNNNNGGTNFGEGGGRDTLMDKFQKMQPGNNNIGDGVDQEALSDLIYAAVAHTDVDVRRDLLNNIQLVGGASLISGLANRLQYELTHHLVPSHLKVRFPAALPVERQHAAWIGGSILGICGSFQQKWVTRAEYEEMGAFRVQQLFDH